MELIGKRVVVTGGAGFFGWFGPTVDSVVHLAYVEPRFDDELLVGRQEYADNLGATIELVAELPRSVRSVVFASSVLVYGPGRGRPQAEIDPADPVNHYAVAKLGVEHALHDWSGHGGRGVALGLSTVYGPGETVPRSILNFIRRSLVGYPCQVAVGVDWFRHHPDLWDPGHGRGTDPAGPGPGSQPGGVAL